MNDVSLMKEIPEQWTPQLEKAIYYFMTGRTFLSDKGNNLSSDCYCFHDVENLMGLAYTSSSTFAAYFSCNDFYYLDAERKIRIIGFSMTTDLFNVVVCEDSEENQFIIYI